MWYDYICKMTWFRQPWKHNGSYRGNISFVVKNGMFYRRLFMAQCKGKCGEWWYHSIIHYNVKHFKGSYGRPESHISSILDYQFYACVMRISGVPQLQVIRMERLYGYK